MNVWVLHLVPQPSAEALKQFSALPLPVDAQEDYTQCTSEHAVRHRLAAHSPDAPPESVNREAARVWHLLSSLHMEDIIAVPLQAEGAVYYAQVSGHARYAEGALEIPVTWYERETRLAVFKRYGALFAAHSYGELLEVREQRTRVFIRDKLPLPGNRFSRLKWLVVILFAMQLLMMGINLWKQETAGF